MDSTMSALNGLEQDLEGRVSAMLERGHFTPDDISWTAGIIERIGNLPSSYRAVFLTMIKLSGLDDRIQTKLRGLENFAGHDMNGDPQQQDAMRLASGLRRTWDKMCGRG